MLKPVSAADRRLLAVADFDEPLIDLANLASQAVPGNDGAGVTIVQDGTPVYRSSNGFSRAVDNAQYRIGEGPCIDAVNHRQTVVSNTLRTGEHRWPRFTAALPELRVGSVLSLPLRVNDGVIGSINLYAHAPDAFDHISVAVGEAFAGPAAVSLSMARVLVDTVDLAAFAGFDLHDRAVVETAVGVLIGRHHLTATAARALLLQTATAAGTNVLAVAADVVADSQGRPHP